MTRTVEQTATVVARGVFSAVLTEHSHSPSTLEFQVTSPAFLSPRRVPIYGLDADVVARIASGTVAGYVLEGARVEVTLSDTAANIIYRAEF